MLFAPSFYNLNSTLNRKEFVCVLFLVFFSFFHSNYYSFIYAFLPFILLFFFPLFVLTWNITFLGLLLVAAHDCCFWSRPVTIDGCFVSSSFGLFCFCIWFALRLHGKKISKVVFLIVLLSLYLRHDYMPAYS